MRRRALSGVVVLFLVLPGLALARVGASPTRRRPFPKQDQIHSLRIEYRSFRTFPVLSSRIGPVVGIAPVTDSRRGRVYIGDYSSGRVTHHFKSEPFPLPLAVQGALSAALSRSGIRTVSVTDWNRKRASLRDADADSLLSVHIDRFWAQGVATPAPKLRTMLYLTFYLGVKKEGTVFTKRVFLGTNETVSQLTAERMETAFSLALDRVLESFLSDPFSTEAP